MVDSVTGGLSARWPAHLFPVKALVAVGGVVYSLSADGAVRGWPAVQPPPPQYVAAWKVREAGTPCRRICGMELQPKLPLESLLQPE